MESDSDIGQSVQDEILATVLSSVQSPSTAPAPAAAVLSSVQGPSTVPAPAAASVLAAQPLLPAVAGGQALVPDQAILVAPAPPPAAPLSPAPVAILHAGSPSVGTVKRLPSKLQVYISSTDGFVDVCNYTFSVAGSPEDIFIRVFNDSLQTHFSYLMIFPNYN